jgi:hypothetical protein
LCCGKQLGVGESLKDSLDFMGGGIRISKEVVQIVIETAA